ncbi:hypothetical protein CERSUDRAFT_78609 [Gelatoporia subvermispora B]|uniref:Uncharacterized protein n=1 Tax=Ceriporiopsis subvermispora (strain B) TaxID=914234 RepID=M2QXY3_CERS8|nr:hypothetical protein CERSUDRAFT_78609 [Gelatoporia subvermispora B]
MRSPSLEQPVGNSFDNPTFLSCPGMIRSPPLAITCSDQTDDCRWPRPALDQNALAADFDYQKRIHVIRDSHPFRSRASLFQVTCGGPNRKPGALPLRQWLVHPYFGAFWLGYIVHRSFTKDEVIVTGWKTTPPSAISPAIYGITLIAADFSIPIRDLDLGRAWCILLMLPTRLQNWAFLWINRCSSTVNLAKTESALSKRPASSTQHTLWLDGAVLCICDLLTMPYTLTRPSSMSAREVKLLKYHGPPGQLYHYPSLAKDQIASLRQCWPHVSVSLPFDGPHEENEHFYIISPNLLPWREWFWSPISGAIWLDRLVDYRMGWIVVVGWKMKTLTLDDPTTTALEITPAKFLLLPQVLELSRAWSNLLHLPVILREGVLALIRAYTMDHTRIRAQAERARIMSVEMATSAEEGQEGQGAAGGITLSKWYWE